MADGIAFPNGMAVTPDNATLIVAESFARRLTAFDIAADGSLSNRRCGPTASAPTGSARTPEGTTGRVSVGSAAEPCWQGPRRRRSARSSAHQLPCFACMLGGEDGKTMFMLAADWHMGGNRRQFARLAEGPRTGQLLTAPAPRPGRRLAVTKVHGWPPRFSFCLDAIARGPGHFQLVRRAARIRPSQQPADARTGSPRRLLCREAGASPCAGRRVVAVGERVLPFGSGERATGDGARVSCP